MTTSALDKKLKNESISKKLQPEKNAKILSEYFELQLADTAIDAYKQKDFLKAAMLSWSYIEEFFLPSSIKFVAKHQKVKLDSNLLTNRSSYHLIRYYFLISYDNEMFDILEEARKLRNKVVHQIYKTKSMATISQRAKESAKYNLFSVLEHMLDRQEGRVIAPALLIATNARNDFRDELRIKLKEMKKNT